ncbi:MAG: hypothetical protein ACLTYL_03285 [Faecalibacterium sp.]
MNLSVSDVENYLEAVKCAVKARRYRLDMNVKRPDNRKLFQTYSLTEEDAEKIILDLNAMDFSDAVPNEHVGFEHETLYIFGKEVLLIERYGTAEKLVPLYIKFNKLDNEFVIVISFHEQRHPLTYYFK